MPKIAKKTMFATLVLLAAMVFGPSSEATTYTMVYDGDLHEQAAVVARVEVLSTSPAPGLGAPHTDHIVLVERLLKGQVSGTTVVVRVLGGVGPDGLGLEVHGVPVLAPRDRALLFLQPREDGTYGILHLMLGAFFEAGSGDGRVALRPFDGLGELGVSSSDEPEQVRDWDRFESWLADRSRGIFRDSDYLTEAVRAHGSLYLPNPLEFEREPIRFFEFDDGEKVTWKVGLGVSKARKSFRKALRAWNGDSATVVLLEQKGRTRNTSGFTAPDGINSIIFGDPNDEIAGTYSCSAGGVVALGGAWFFSSPALMQKIPKDRGKGKANVALEADIIVNDGAECLVSGDVKAAAQVFGHELGHALGLGHSCDDAGSGRCRTESRAEALMRAFFHDDGRGAVLYSWDRKGLDELY